MSYPATLREVMDLYLTNSRRHEDFISLANTENGNWFDEFIESIIASFQGKLLHVSDHYHFDIILNLIDSHYSQPQKNGRKPPINRSCIILIAGSELSLRC